jgi:hypothetical protein
MYTNILILTDGSGLSRKAVQPSDHAALDPRFNAVSGVDDCAWTGDLYGNSLVNGARKLDRTTVSAVAGILAALAVVYACALILL